MLSLEFAVCAAGLEKPHETAANIAAQGVRAIETGADFFLNSAPFTIREAANAFRDKGIRIRSVHAPFGKDCNLSSPNPGIRRRAIETHAQTLRQCAYGGVYVIIVHPGTDEAPERIPEMLEWIVESLRELAPVAEDTGVKMGLENLLPKTPGTTAEELIAVLDAVNSPALGICFDSGHAHCNGIMADVFEKVKDRLITFHIHDNDGKRDLHLSPPYGTIDWEAFTQIFRTMNFRDSITLEARPWNGGNYARLMRDVGDLLEGMETRIVNAEKKG